MALQVATGISATAITGVLNFSDDLRSSRYRARVMRIRVFDDDIGALRFDQAQLIRLLNQFTKLVFVDRAEHHHAITER